MAYSDDKNDQLLVLKLDETCWYGKVNNITQKWVFKIIPTFSHKEGSFKLRYYDQCFRYTRDFPYLIFKDHLLLKAEFAGKQYTSKYIGVDKLIWTNNLGEIMTWEKTK